MQTKHKMGTDDNKKEHKAKFCYFFNLGNCKFEDDHGMYIHEKRRLCKFQEACVNKNCDFVHEPKSKAFLGERQNSRFGFRSGRNFPPKRMWNNMEERGRIGHGYPWMEGRQPMGRDNVWTDGWMANRGGERTFGNRTFRKN